MELHHPKPEISDSYGFEKLENEELNTSSQNDQQFEGSSLGVHQRTLIFAKNLNQSSSSALSTPVPNASKEGPQSKRLNSFFGICYQVWMFILGSVHLLNMFEALSLIREESKFENFAMLMRACTLAQHSFAFIGARRENLEKIDKALILMKVWFCLQTFIFLERLFSERQLQEMVKSNSGVFKFRLSDGDFYFPLEQMVCVFILIFLPTIKVRNILRSPSEGSKLTTCDPIEKLNSRIYIAYKYWIWIHFCLASTWIIRLIPKELPSRDTFARMASVRELWKNLELPSCLLNLFFLPLLFEGFRRRSFEKMGRVMKGMLMTQAFRYIQLFSFGYFIFMEEDQGEKFFQDSYLGDDIIRWIPLFAEGLTIIGATKVREILKAHQKAL